MSRLRRFVSALTFMGVIFHEFGHKLFCNLTGVKVYRVCYFRIGNPAGYVVHERPRNFLQSFFVAVGPFITGTLFAMLFFYLAKNQATHDWQQVLFIWLGFSVAVNAFPSDTDASGLWRDSNRHIRSNLFSLIGYPFALIIWLANGLHFIFFDILYAFMLYHLVDSFLFISF